MSLALQKTPKTGFLMTRPICIFHFASMKYFSIITLWPFSSLSADSLQDRRRLLKSGPAEEVIECRMHERGIITPLVRGGVWGGASPEKIFEF